MIAPEAGPLLVNAGSKIDQFNVFRVAYLMRGYHAKPPMAFDRRAYYKISLLRGRSRLEYADQGVDIAQFALWFATSRVPRRRGKPGPALTSGDG